MNERRWRLGGWEWGWEDEPRLNIEFDDGEKKALQISSLYDDYSDDLACVTEPEDYLPEQWFALMMEACEDCEDALGSLGFDGDRWHFDDDSNPCRWHQQAELDALYEHAKTNTLFDRLEEEELG